MIDRNPIPRVRASSSRSYADDASGGMGGALDSTREFAAQALERAAEKMRDLRYGVADTASAAQRQMGHYATTTTRYVSEEPVKAALIAAGVGALIAGVVLMSRRRGGRY